MKIGITSPIYVKNEEHKRYLDLTTRSIVSTEHDIVWIPVENYIDSSLVPLSYTFDHEPDQISIVKPQGQQSVSKAWNLGILEAKRLDCDYVLVINHDIVFKTNAIDRLVAFANSCVEDRPGFDENAVMWTMAEYADLALLEESPEDENFSEHPHFSCFMVKPDFFKHVGMFDENFIPAYLEDGCCHARLALSNLKAYIYGGARFYHFGSRIIKSDQEEWEKNKITFPRNQQYFLEKFGHPPVNEVTQMREIYFKHPYNIQELAINEYIPDFWNFLKANNVDHIKDVPKEKVLAYLQERGLR